MSPELAEEEFAFALLQNGYFTEIGVLFPKFIDRMFEQSDKRAVFLYLKQLIRIMSAFRSPRSHWTFKTPYFAFFPHEMMNTFPGTHALLPTGPLVYLLTYIHMQVHYLLHTYIHSHCTHTDRHIYIYIYIDRYECLSSAPPPICPPPHPLFCPSALPPLRPLFVLPFFPSKPFFFNIYLLIFKVASSVVNTIYFYYHDHLTPSVIN